MTSSSILIIVILAGLLIILRRPTRSTEWVYVPVEVEVPARTLGCMPIIAIVLIVILLAVLLPG